ncbi:hypothetical protein OGR47_10080 [Methylocystis sp. MJC1]|jgi:hypothetical protein|uniref:hypothetical protein n=1 Tax=Methylocystis sp. MJC1 TaxID=2654282 RepID=UPI0013EA25C7|nr:hypothetical protein [Methylocystis sp. MJC1]MBU6527334.1 hypothetical protein [Methylocystis sp. MJC1]UZX10285.1 hypothetical protein OGR47_10080 [Methylocystis sp. MJC1]
MLDLIFICRLDFLVGQSALEEHADRKPIVREARQHRDHAPLRQPRSDAAAERDSSDNPVEPS